MCAASPTANAADEAIHNTLDQDISFQTGLGYTWLRSNELVLDDFGRISQLIWKTRAPVVTAKISAEIANNWRVTANAATGFSGNSHMEDYDWFDLAPGTDFDDLDQRSVHPDTNLDRYLDLSIAIGREFELNDAVSINLNGASNTLM